MHEAIWGAGTRQACLPDGRGKGLGVNHGFQLAHAIHGTLYIAGPMHGDAGL